MQVAVLGSGNFDNYGLLKSTLLNLMNSSAITELVSADTLPNRSLAGQFAEEYQIPLNSIAIEREIEKSDALVVFWNGSSRAASAAIARAERAGKPVYVVPTA